jgi:hypothetical protein
LTSSYQEFKPTTEQEARAEWAMLRNALGSLDSAYKRIKDMGHTPTTARERLALLDHAIKDGSK